MGPKRTSRPGNVTRYLLDTTVLVSHLRGNEDVAAFLLGMLSRGHSLCTSCVNVAEIERGIRPKEAKETRGLLDHLDFLVTTKEAATRAGRYQADLEKRGQTLHLADALIAGTARAHGAILITDDVKDFPLADIRVQRPKLPRE
jgi:predicted nucleic acid-binding protein